MNIPENRSKEAETFVSLLRDMSPSEVGYVASLSYGYALEGTTSVVDLFSS
jgi:hypothetical protein